MFQTLTALGRIGQDPELRYTQAGKEVTNISVAVENSYKDSSGEWKKNTEWLAVVIWGGAAKFIAEHAKKGSLVFLTGRLATKKYQKDGIDRYKTEVVADQIKLLDPKEGNGSAPAAKSAGKPAARNQDPMDEELTDDDIDSIPF